MLLVILFAAPTDVLLDYARSKGLWRLFSDSNRTSLLYCVADGADEVKKNQLRFENECKP